MIHAIWYFFVCSLRTWIIGDSLTGASSSGWTSRLSLFLDGDCRFLGDPMRGVTGRDRFSALRFNLSSKVFFANGIALFCLTNERRFFLHSLQSFASEWRSRRLIDFTVSKPYNNSLDCWLPFLNFGKIRQYLPGTPVSPQAKQMSVFEVSFSDSSSTVSWNCVS